MTTLNGISLYSWAYTKHQAKITRRVKNYDPTMRESEEADYEDVVIPYADEPLASQQFI